MALGSATVASRNGHDARPVRFDVISFAGDNSYPTGGTTAFEAFVRAAVARGALEVLAVIPLDCGGYVPVYDYADDKLKVYYVDNNNASDGPMIQVPNTTDLSGTTFRVMVLSV